VARSYAQARRGPVLSRTPRLSEFLEYWLAEVVRPDLAPLTVRTYETFGSALYRSRSGEAAARSAAGSRRAGMAQPTSRSVPMLHASNPIGGKYCLSTVAAIGKYELDLLEP
jgi:hypothetical protein